MGCGGKDLVDSTLIAAPKDTIAISRGANALTWEQLERGANRRARAFAAKGVKAGDFRRLFVRRPDVSSHQRCHT
jgi:hypothetical protein